MAMRVKFFENFKEQVPDSVTFDAGYCEGQKHAKVWVVTDDRECMTSTQMVGKSLSGVREEVETRQL